MAGIYIHIPFCKKRCIYCDFFSSVSMGKKAAYVQAVCEELKERKDYLNGQNIQTIYFGGGTPSQLSAKDFEKIFEAIYSNYFILDAKENVSKDVIARAVARSNPLEVCNLDCFATLAMTKNKTFESADAKSPLGGWGQKRQWQEITLEANPDDITAEYLESIKHLPFNRISLGVQSFVDEELRFLNRRHDADTAKNAVKLCQEYGFENISIDLIYGIPGQTNGSWAKTLNEAIQLNVPHISAYHLIYEEDTPLFRLLKENKLEPIAEELSIQLFETLMDTLSEAEFEHYEISNFARKGYRSRHNSNYWNGSYYLGVGASAHSYNGISRSWNKRTLVLTRLSSLRELARSNPDKEWIASATSCLAMTQHNKLGKTFDYRGGAEDMEIIDAKTAYNDFIITRLRTSSGINLSELETLHGKEKTDYCLRQAQKHLENQLLLKAGNQLKLTRKGIFISDSIMSDLML